MAKVSFGEWLKRRRAAEGWTQEQLARQIHCSTSALRKFESEERRPSAEVVEQLIDIFNIPLKERTSFLHFARGDWQAMPEANLEDVSWHISSARAMTVSNLPIPTSSFIGRDKELLEIADLVRRMRLVTLTGVGGIGKSRLSLQTASALSNDFPDGIWLVELAPVSDPTLVAQVIANTFGLTEQGNRAPQAILVDFLKTRKVLIILDNCEHLIHVCAQVAEFLLQSCPGLHILATSREALSIAGENIYRVPSLSMPDPAQSTFADLLQFESVQLLVERIQSTNHDFSLTQDIALAIAQICRQLDGIPLALELAAARVNVLQMEDIVTRLDQRFKLLTGGTRTALPRHQTLEAVIDWSHDLLSDPERLLFYRLSIFAGGWTLEAAESVCEGDGIQKSEILNLLIQLFKKSLLLADHKQGGELRYRMLETIRQYAYEKLLQDGSSNSIRDRHLAYFVRLVEQTEPELYRSNQVFWLKKLDRELDNIYTTMEWALTNNSKLGLQLLVSWVGYWGDRGNVRMIRGWLAQLLERYHEKDALRARALVIHGNILENTGDHAQAQAYAQQGLELARLISDKHAEAFSLWGLGVAMAMQGNQKQGIPLVEQSLALYQSMGDKLGQAYALDWLSINQSNPERSKAYLVESLRLYRELGHLWGIAYCLSDLGQLTIGAGDFSFALDCLKEAKEIFRELGNQAGEAWVLNFWGTLAYRQGDYQQACDYFDEAIALFERLGLSGSYWPRVHLAYTFLRQGNLTKARDSFDLGIRLFREEGNVIGVIYAMEGIASLYLIQEKAEHATKLTGWADALRETIGNYRSPLEQNDVDKNITACLARMGKAAFSDAYENGKNMSLEEAITFALERGF